MPAGVTTGVSGVCCCAHGGRYYRCFRCLLLCSWRALLRVFPVFVAVLMVGVTTGVSGVCCCAHGGRYYGCFRCLLLSSWRALLRVFQVFVAMFMQCLRCINQLPLFVVFPLSSHFCLTVQHCAVWSAIMVLQHVVVMVKGMVQNKLDSHKRHHYNTLWQVSAPENWGTMRVKHVLLLVLWTWRKIKKKIQIYSAFHHW